MKRFFQRTISFLLAVSIIIGSGFAAAAAPTIALAATENTAKTSDGTLVNAQSYTYVNGVQSGNGIAKSGSLANTAGGAVSCAGGQILGQLLTSTISSGVSSLAGSVTGVSAGGGLKVPVNPDGTQLEAETRTHTSATAGTLDPTGLTLTQPSWDSIAWCVVNSIIEYLVDATIQWAKTGFNGNPAFVNNPEGFFKGIADQEAGAFIQEIAGGKNGINVCQPFRAQIAIGLASAYGVNEGRRLSCSLSSIANNVANAAGTVNGGFDYNQFFTTSQYDQNNPRALYILGNDELGARVEKKGQTAQLELGWNQGFLNFRHCEDNGNGDGKKTCLTDTPGTLIQSSLEKSLGIPKDRLVLAQKFDQLVTVLINSLIQVALNKVLDSSKTSSSK